MLPDAFTRVMRNVDWNAPLIVVTQAGQINTGAFDPHSAIIHATRAHSNCWIHVDGAFGLWARACPTHAALADGIEGADSWATDGHKWLQTPYDCGYAIVRNADALACAGSLLSAWQAAVEPARDREGVELADLLTCARLVTEAALMREESRGAHFRRDFPVPCEEWRRHLVFKRD